jgi:uncharacterized lipoprotein YddW (UPF0748 family)
MPDTAEGCDRVVNRLADAGFDLLIPCVKFMDGMLEYPSEVGPVREGFEEFDALEAMCASAKKKNIKLHAWFCVFPEGENTPIVQKDRSVLGKNPDGEPIMPHGMKGHVWTCPRRQEVQEYEMKLYLEVLDRYPVEGVHLDYIRYNGRDACFCPTCRESFEKTFGEDIMNMLDERQHPVYVPALEWRAEPVTRFVRNLHEETSSRGRELSAAVFAHYPTCYGGQGQDWWKWAQEGIIDCLYPMNYSPSPTHVTSITLSHIAMIKKPVVLWEGLKFHKWDSREHYMEVVKSAVDTGIEGIVLFEYNGPKDDTWEELAKL